MSKMDDIGYAGTPANERWLPDDQIATVFDKSASFAKTMFHTSPQYTRCHWNIRCDHRIDRYQCPRLPQVVVT